MSAIGKLMYLLHRGGNTYRPASAALPLMYFLINTNPPARREFSFALSGGIPFPFRRGVSSDNLAQSLLRAKGTINSGH